MPGVLAGLMLCGFAMTAFANPILLFAAGGGGGAGNHVGKNGKIGLADTTTGGSGDGPQSGAGGTDGSGGGAGYYGQYNGGGGAGWSGNGASGQDQPGQVNRDGAGGHSPADVGNPGAGGAGGNYFPYGSGGFWGGGGGGVSGGGGGGGYSGGGGGSGKFNSNPPTYAGGGGGSFINTSLVSGYTEKSGANGTTDISGLAGKGGMVGIYDLSISYSQEYSSDIPLINWTAPVSANYLFVVDGAQGGMSGYAYGGYGAELTGYVYLSAGDQLVFMVGGGGYSGYDRAFSQASATAGGGGGGTFVAENLPGSAVPEPESIALVTLGVALSGFARRRQEHRSRQLTACGFS